MTDVPSSRLDAFPAEYYQFKAMAKARKAQVDPSWREGFGYGSFTFVVGIFFLLSAWATWGREYYGEEEISPGLTLIFGLALVAHGLWRREVRVRVPLYGVLIDGQAKDITWANKWSMQQRAASRGALLKAWQSRHPGAEVDFMDVGEAWVYVPRHMLEYAGASALLSR